MTASLGSKLYFKIAVIRTTLKQLLSKVLSKQMKTEESHLEMSEEK